jgi:RimJ/RimL family protein N-acetyltransferase
VLTVIETARLILRPLREDDRSVMIDLHTDPCTTRFEPTPPSGAEVDVLVDSWLAHWSAHGYGYCAVTTRNNRNVVGLAGIRVHDLHGERVLNLAYRFLPEVWGHGYAVEAATAVVDWRARELPGVPLVASVVAVNDRSSRVAERIGFSDYTEQVTDGVLSRLYRLDAAQTRPSRT